MGVIRNRQTSIGTVYEKLNDDNEVIHKVGVVGFVRRYEGNWYFIIHDIKGNLIDEANEYLNVMLEGAGYKKRELAFTALKLFYSFVHLFYKKDYQHSFGYEDVKRLIRFLEGGKSKQINWDMDFSQYRSNSTINSYLNVYRDLYKTMFRVSDSPFFLKSTIGIQSGGGMMGHANKKSIEKYKLNKKVNRKLLLVPKYIKNHQYEAIMNLIEESYSIREKAIITLMYKYGLRLGEVLGLTFEDIEEGEYGNSRIIIRNRFSDKPFQSAKSVMSIKSIDDYNSPSYSTYGIGYQIVVIDDEMKEMIEEYIDESRDAFLLSNSDKKRENLKIKAKADRVGTIPLINDENQYIFLNHQHYTPLTATGWNYILRKIFNTVGIVVDQGVRENNLSHRFRHGFAMNKVAEGYTIEKLADALRHSTTDTCKRYYNPDEEDKAELLKENNKRLEERYGFEKQTIKD